MSTRVFVPIDSSALSLGAERVAAAIAEEAQKRVVPVYESFEGWKGTTAGARSWAQLAAAYSKAW